MPDDSTLDDVAGSDSRRDLLKKVGIGTAVAWTAPTILSTATATAATGGGNPPVPCPLCGQVLWIDNPAAWLGLTFLEATGLIPGCVFPFPPVGETATPLPFPDPPGSVNVVLPPGPPSCALPPLLPALPNASGIVMLDLNYMIWLFTTDPLDPLRPPPPPFLWESTPDCWGRTLTIDGRVNVGGPGLYVLALFTDGTTVASLPYDSFPPPDPTNPPPVSVTVPGPFQPTLPRPFFNGATGFLGFVVANLDPVATFDVDITNVGVGC